MDLSGADLLSAITTTTGNLTTAVCDMTRPEVAKDAAVPNDATVRTSLSQAFPRTKRSNLRVVIGDRDYYQDPFYVSPDCTLGALIAFVQPCMRRACRRNSEEIVGENEEEREPGIGRIQVLCDNVELPVDKFAWRFAQANTFPVDYFLKWLY